MLGDKKEAYRIKHESDSRFTLLMKFTAWIMKKYSSLYEKVK